MAKQGGEPLLDVYTRTLFEGGSPDQRPDGLSDEDYDKAIKANEKRIKAATGTKTGE